MRTRQLVYSKCFKVDTFIKFKHDLILLSNSYLQNNELMKILLLWETYQRTIGDPLKTNWRFIGGDMSDPRPIGDQHV